MTTMVELLSGMLRYFPNTLITSLFVMGIALGKIAWILVGIGAIAVTIATLTLQYILNKTLNVGPLPGASVLEACSLLPISSGTYSTTPSLWISLTTFFVTYIFINASNVYTAAPARVSQDAIQVQQRKSVGLISMVTVALLFLFLIVPRFRTQCETIMGVLLGSAVGVVGGWGWWVVLHACGPDVYSDIHGVMAGLKPGALHTSPMACAAKDTEEMD
jgi:hypothetical protein